MSRRGRPSASRVNEIDATIHKVALALFLEHGFHAVTMDMLAEQAQVSKATLYTRHAGKVELLDAVVKAELWRLLESSQQQGQQLPVDLSERLLYHARNIIDCHEWSAIKRLERLIGSVSAEHPDIHREPYEVILAHATNYLAEDFRQVAEAEGYQLSNHHFFAEMFFHSILGWYHAVSMTQQVSGDQIENYIQHVVAVIVMAFQAEAIAKNP